MKLTNTRTGVTVDLGEADHRGWYVPFRCTWESLREFFTTAMTVGFPVVMLRNGVDRVFLEYVNVEHEMLQPERVRVKVKLAPVMDPPRPIEIAAPPRDVDDSMMWHIPAPAGDSTHVISKHVDVNGLVRLPPHFGAGQRLVRLTGQKDPKENGIWVCKQEDAHHVSLWRRERIHEQARHHQ